VAQQQAHQRQDQGRALKHMFVDRSGVHAQAGRLGRPARSEAKTSGVHALSLEIEAEDRFAVALDRFAPFHLGLVLPLRDGA